MAQLPESVREIADEVGVPIISIPYESSWTDIINPIMTGIINLHAAQLERSDIIRKRLIEQVLGKGGLPEIVRVLSEFVENPVAIIYLATNQLFSNANLPSSSDTDFVSEFCLPREMEVSTIIQHIPQISKIQGARSRVVVPIEALQVKTGYIIILDYPSNIGKHIKSGR